MASSNSSGGIGLCGATFLVFLVLKLTGTIDWSWWWVTAPLWIPIGIVIVLAALLGLMTAFGKKGRRTLLLFLAAFMLTGCASIFSPKATDVTFETTPPGKTIHVNGRPVVTPTTLKLSTRETHEVVWPDGTTEEFGRDFNGLFILDIVILSPLAIVIDLATGAVTWNISPDEYHWPKAPPELAPAP